MSKIINNIERKDLRWIRISQLQDKLSLSERTIRRLMKTDPSFPKPFTVLNKVVVFWEQDIDLWMLKKATPKQAMQSLEKQTADLMNKNEILIENFLGRLK